MKSFAISTLPVIGSLLAATAAAQTTTDEARIGRLGAVNNGLAPR